MRFISSRAEKHLPASCQGSVLGRRVKPCRRSWVSVSSRQARERSRTRSEVVSRQQFTTDRGRCRPVDQLEISTTGSNQTSSNIDMSRGPPCFTTQYFSSHKYLCILSLPCPRAPAQYPPPTGGEDRECDSDYWPPPTVAHGGPSASDGPWCTEGRVVLWHRCVLRDEG